MNNRKLLPYEHELIKALGISREEYLEFLAVQRDFVTSPEEQLQELRAGVGIAALVLTIVGTLFQVASVLLAPRPSLPGARNQNQPRDARFAPRFGFNGSQELAQYGEPINLIYCNTAQNPKGAVRAGMSLVWSSVESYGSSQFMQLLLVLGAASVKRIDFSKVAFGQLPISDFGSANAWIYYKQNGRPTFGDRFLGDTLDPSRLSAASTEAVCRLIAGGQRLEGYSQSFSPSSKTSIGVYSPIPINVNVIERAPQGTPLSAVNGVSITGNAWQATNNQWQVGNTISVVLIKTVSTSDKLKKDVVNAANELRYQYATALEAGSVYLLGTAKFKLISISGDQDLDNTNVVANFRCIEAGRRPFTNYERLLPDDANETTRNGLEASLAQLNSPYQGQTSAAKGSVFISFTPTTDAYNGLKEALPTIVINFGTIRYDFTGTRTVSWKDDLDKAQSYVLDRKGSLAYTKAQLEVFLSKKPKLSTTALRKEYRSDLTKAKKLRNQVIAGKYDSSLKSVSGTFNASIAKLDTDIANLQEKLETTTNKKQKADYRKSIEKLRDQKQDLFRQNAGDIRIAYSNTIYSATSPFKGLDGNTYAAGVDRLEDLIDGLKGEFVVDQRGVDTVTAAFAALIDEKENAIQTLEYVSSNWRLFKNSLDDGFFNKCLVKAESASYQSVTSCNFVKFAMKCRVFRRVSGRATEYGKKDAPKGYKLSDNGIKGRIVFFKVLYRAENSPTFLEAPIVFAIRRGADQDNFIGLTFRGASASRWQFRLEPIADILAEVQQSGQTRFAFIENTGKESSYTHSGSRFSWVGDLVDTSLTIKKALRDRAPADTNEWDLFSVRSDTRVQFSFDNGPEISITSVTEQQLASTSGRYGDMSTMAFGVYSGRGVQDLRSVSAYVTEGKASWVVNETTGARSRSNNSTSYAPDIFADTVLDTNDGIGKYAKADGIGWEDLALAKRFCKNNGLGCQLFMDGVIADVQPWRQFWAEVAPYSLLELGKIGGRETLIPAVPVAADGRANREVVISALFNQGNILEGSYREEFIDYGASVQDLIATVIYRDTSEQDVFPRNASVDVLLKDVVEQAAIRQTFDLSQFVSQREQAVLYGKLLCNQRRWIRRGIEFQTFPTDSPISPGAYIYVDVGLNTWDSITSGVVMAGGALNAPLSSPIASGSYSVLLYKTGAKVVSLDSVSVSGGTASSLAAYEGHLFVLGSKADRKRVFRVTEVQMDEEGQVTVKAMEHPCEASGNLLLSRIANFSNSLFSIR
jgi:hypothetical protein